MHPIALRRADLIDTWYRQYGALVLRRGGRILGSEAEGRELLQDVFVSLLTSEEDLDAVQQPAAWLYAVATRLALRRLRDTKNRSQLLEAELGNQLYDAAISNPSDAIDLMSMLGGIPEDERMALVYFYVDEMSHDEIAEQLKCSRRHVGNLLTRARTMLRATNDDLKTTESAYD